MEQLLMSRFIICLLQIAASTASTVLCSVSLFFCFFSYCCLNTPVSTHIFFFLKLFPLKSPPLLSLPFCLPSLFYDARASLSRSFCSLSASQFCFPFVLSRSKALNFILRLVLCPVEAQAFTVFLDQDEHDCDEAQILVWTLTVHITIYMTL